MDAHAMADRALWGHDLRAICSLDVLLTTQRHRGTIA